jgi:methionyl-tRNA formyltransferase
MLKVVFFGHSQTVLSNRHFQALQKIPCQLLGVVDTPPFSWSSTDARPQIQFPSFTEVARAAGIPVWEPANPNEPDFVEVLAGLAPDLFLAVGYTKLLKSSLLAAPRIFAVNFHASLLPAYRGKHPLFWALRNGERWVGLTAHMMDPNLDTGDILYQVRVRTRKSDSVSTLYDRIMDRSVGLVGRLLHDVERGQIRRTPQPGEGASYYSSTKVEDFKLDWSREAEQLRRWIQTSPGQCFADIAGQRVFPMDAEVVARGEGVASGVLIHTGRTSCTVAAGKDALRMRKVREDPGGVKSVPLVLRELGFEPGRSLMEETSPAPRS